MYVLSPYLPFCIFKLSFVAKFSSSFIGLNLTPICTRTHSDKYTDSFTHRHTQKILLQPDSMRKFWMSRKSFPWMLLMMMIMIMAGTARPGRRRTINYLKRESCLALFLTGRHGWGQCHYLNHRADSKSAACL